MWLVWMGIVFSFFLFLFLASSTSRSERIECATMICVDDSNGNNRFARPNWNELNSIWNGINRAIGSAHGNKLWSNVSLSLTSNWCHFHDEHNSARRITIHRHTQSLCHCVANRIMISVSWSRAGMQMSRWALWSSEKTLSRLDDSSERNIDH